MKHIVTNRSKRPVPLPHELMPLQPGESREIEIGERKAERLARYGVLAFVQVATVEQPAPIEAEPLAIDPVATPFDDEPDEPEARPAEEEPADDHELQGE